ncbi:MAG: methyltransferase domain-containing protein, partial [Candidatus Obscuribacterales bacterium]|nr:methyltransferase domain-containing protein [Candidatus Obscuribacterales bacterium]
MTGQPQAQPNVGSPDFWELCYQQGKTPWEYGSFAPPLKTFLTTPYKMPPGNLAVLGCGTGHDALLLAQSGYQVTAIDFCQSAINATYQKFEQAGLAGKTAFLLHRNIFDLYEYHGYFDSIFEHTCFCSIDPGDRKRYFLPPA